MAKLFLRCFKRLKLANIFLFAAERWLLLQQRRQRAVEKKSGSPGRRLAEGPTRQAETGSQSNESKPEAANTKRKGESCVLQM